MAAVGVSFVSLLNAVAWHCRLPSVSYLWELDGNDALPSDESPSKTAKYGFAVHDYNLQTLLSYRQIAASAVDAALTASTHLARFRARYGPMDLSCECILRQCIALWSNFVKEDHFFYSTYRP
ncbi:Os01g0250300 [Oryza sativa Japonica Group]|uniref:Os01g0250300 protein n=1 Tax=Oryza sativa subsp. japonica TaxID=39947 RepID=Q0JP20_ORYSJ|nr:Os01g0250300 [Oryza sativa Japonica Group]|eukprot:NP_001042594.1 Os01g0250300 [Oryza sativa Japonica Group]